MRGYSPRMASLMPPIAFSILRGGLAFQSNRYERQLNRVHCSRLPSAIVVLAAGANGSAASAAFKVVGRNPSIPGYQAKPGTCELSNPEPRNPMQRARPFGQ